MKIRTYKPEDAETVDEIYNRCHGHFALPDINHCVSMAIVEDDEGKIIAFGAFELIPELTLVLDNQVSKRDQVKALKELLEAGSFIAKVNRFKQINVFPDSTVYAGILNKHFGFEMGRPIMTKVVE